MVSFAPFFESSSSLLSFTAVSFRDKASVSALDRQKMIATALKRIHSHPGESWGLHYHPCYTPGDRQLMGLAVGLRWHHPQLGPISPQEFVPLAEKLGTVITLGEWSLRQACRQYHRWQNPEISPLKLGIGLSLIQLSHPDFLPRLHRILQETAMAPEQLQFEIPERAISDVFSQHMDKIHELRRWGISLAVDNFGTGHSSLAILKKLPFQCLKIDASFLTDLAPGSKAWVILESLVNLGDRLQLEIIAKGVETSEQLDLLERLGFEGVQGNYFKDFSLSITESNQ